MSFCKGCGAMKKTEQITVHLDSTNKSFILARANLLEISGSEYVASLIAADRLRIEREFNVMREVFEGTGNQ